MQPQDTWTSLPASVSLRNQKLNIFIIQYRISQRINQIFEILELYCFSFTALKIDKTFTQGNFLPSKIETMCQCILQ